MKHNNKIIKNEIIEHKNDNPARKIAKISKNEFIIPKMTDYISFINNNYGNIFLKKICKFYKLKVSGNKPELTSRIYDFLYQSNYAIIIQKNMRRYFRLKYNKLIGPAWLKRSLCMNSTDFLTFENIINISYNEFFSYKSDIDNSVWGFNIISFYNLFVKGGNDVFNPFTREKISFQLFDNIKQIVRYNKIFNTPINIVLNNDVQAISSKKRIELKCLELFQYIDELGNYTDIKWFTSLNRQLLIKFIRYLFDIWEYRAQLTSTVKIEICHPYGNPFRYIDYNYIEQYNYLLLQKCSLSIIEQFIKKGINRESCNLGASYVLCALTLVNDSAAEALPWLYQSVADV